MFGSHLGFKLIVGAVVILLYFAIAGVVKVARGEDAPTRDYSAMSKAELEAECARLAAQLKIREAEVARIKAENATLAAKLKEATPDDAGLDTGLIVCEYAKTKAQLENPKAPASEADLGKPLIVRTGTPSERGAFAFTDDRQMIAKGLLRIDKAGEYGFTVYGQNTGGAAIKVGNTLIEQDATKNGEQVTWVKLPKGVTVIQIAGRLGNHDVTLKWIKPGDKELSPILASAYAHRRADREKLASIGEK